MVNKSPQKYRIETKQLENGHWKASLIGKGVKCVSNAQDEQYAKKEGRRMLRDRLSL